MTHYPFTKLSELSFQFTTSYGMVYSAYFLAYDYLFVDYPDFAKDVYAFNLDLLVGDVEDRTMDEKVGLYTITLFILLFLVLAYL